MEDSIQWMIGGLVTAGTIGSALVGYIWVTDAIARKRAPKLDAEYGAIFRENYALLEKAVKRQDYGKAQYMADAIDSLSCDLNRQCLGLYTAYACLDIRQIIRKAGKLQPSMSTLEDMIRGDKSNNFLQ